MDYKILYATLVGRVDKTVTALENIAEQQAFDWFHVVQVTEMLKTALLEAEEAYIKAAEEMAGSLIILPTAPKDQPKTPDRTHPQE